MALSCAVLLLRVMAVCVRCRSYEDDISCTVVTSYLSMLPVTADSTSERCEPLLRIIPATRASRISTKGYRVPPIYPMVSLVNLDLRFITNCHFRGRKGYQASPGELSILSDDINTAYDRYFDHRPLELTSVSTVELHLVYLLRGPELRGATTTQVSTNGNIVIMDIRTYLWSWIFRR